MADHYRIIKELEEERRQLSRAIHALEQIAKTRGSAVRKTIRQGKESVLEQKDGTTGKVVPFVQRLKNEA